MKEFNADRKKRNLYAVLSTLVALLLVLNFAMGIVHNTKNSANIASIELDHNITSKIFVQSSQQDVGMKVFMLIFTLVIYGIFLNNILVAHRKLIVDDVYLHVFPSFDETKIEWKSVHAIQVGYMHDQGMRLPFYRMKILYTLDGERLKHTSIPVMRFEDYEGLISHVKALSQAKKIEFYKV